MHKVEIRPGVGIAYEDDWFGKPWSVPETVVMVHGNSESSRAWVSWVTHLADEYRVIRPDLPGFAPRLSRRGTAGVPANSPPTSPASWMR